MLREYTIGLLICLFLLGSNIALSRVGGFVIPVTVTKLFSTNIKYRVIQKRQTRIIMNGKLILPTANGKRIETPQNSQPVHGFLQLNRHDQWDNAGINLTAVLAGT